MNRRQQPIEYFDAIDFGVPAKEISPQRARRERRLYLLLFDELYSIPGRLARAQRAAAYAVEQSNPETDLFSVATYSSNKGVQFATPFLADRIAIRRAIDTLSISHARDPLGLAITTGERDEWISVTQNEQSGSSQNTRGIDVDAEMAEMLKGGAAFQDLQDDEQRHRIYGLLDDFRDLAARLSALEGQKHILYLSEGFRSSLIHGGVHTVPGGVTMGGGFDSHGLNTLENMFVGFRAAGVFLDSVDILGVRHAQTTLQPYENDSLQFMAHGTGGEFVHNQNNLSTAIVNLTKAQQVVYVLAFSRHDNRGGSIDVRVKGLPRGSRVSYRQGFGTAGRTKEVDPLQLADILINDVPQNGFSVGLTTSPSDIAVALRREEITSQVANAVVDVVVYVFDKQGAVVKADHKQLFIDSEKGPAVFHTAIDLPAGRYVVKALARIDGTSSLGFARREFRIE